MNPPSRLHWRTPLDIAGLLLLVWLFLHIFQFEVAMLVQSLLWSAHDVAPFVPQPGDKTVIPLVGSAIWLAVPLLVVLLLVGVVKSDPGEIE